MGFGSGPEVLAFLAGKTTMRRVGCYLRELGDGLFSNGAVKMCFQVTPLLVKAYLYILGLAFLLNNVKKKKRVLY